MAFDNSQKNKPEKQLSRIIQFREKHPCKHLEVDGVHWEYISCGNGPYTLLILPGGLRIAEHAYTYMEIFEDSYRVIVPTYPALENIDDITNGIVAILNVEVSSEVFVLGQSYGGIVAQVFVQRFPNRVKKLILSGTGPLLATNIQAIILAIIIFLVKVLPGDVVKRLYKESLSKIVVVQESESLFWKDYLQELFSKRLTKSDVISHFLSSKDAIRKYAFDRTEVKPWQGKILILAGEKDPVSTESDWNAIAKFYPYSQIQIIPGAGHTAGMSNPDKYAKIVKEFLN